MKPILLLSAALSASVALFANTVNDASYAKISTDGVVEKLESAAQQKAINSFRGGYLTNQIKLHDGVNINIIKDRNGYTYKTILDTNNPSKVNIHSSNTIAPKAIDETNLKLFEGFEGYDGTTANWIPDNWTAIRTDGILDVKSDSGVAGQGTWYVSGWIPYEGDWCGTISYLSPSDIAGTDIEQQDEWLVSPIIAIDEGDYLELACWYYPIFFFDIMSDDTVDWDTWEFIDQRIAATLKIQISTDGGESWTEFYDFADPYWGMSFNDIYSDWDGWHYHSFDLSDYAGQEIQVAFEYVGIDGNIMHLDNISVGGTNNSQAATACYISPVGSFHYGLSENYESYEYHSMLMPADTELTWANTSDGATYVWTYDDGTNNTATSGEENLTTRYPEGTYFAPTLAATYDGSSYDEYSDADILYVGGGPSVAEGTPLVGTYNVDTQGFSQITSGGSYIFGWNPNSESVWSSLFGTTVNLTYLANLFDKPSVPYTLSHVSIFGYGEFDSSASYDLNVISVDDSGILGDTIAVAHCSASEIIFPMSDNYFTMPFNLMVKDNTGLEVESSIEVSTAIFVSLSTSNNGSSNFCVFCTAYPDPNELTYGYFGIELEYGGEIYNYLYSIDIFSISTGTLYGSLYFSLDANYPSTSSSIKGISSDSATTAKVTVDGEYFIVTAPESISNVTVYSVSGQALVTSNISGTTTIDASALSKGVYILRFNDGGTVKVLK